MKTIKLTTVFSIFLVATAFSTLQAGCEEQSDGQMKKGVAAAVKNNQAPTKVESSVSARASKKKGEKPTPAEPAGKVKVTKSVQDDVNSQIEQSAGEKRKKISEEARNAMRETENALKALDEKRPKDALAALEKALGKLDLLVAREPELAMAPTAISVATLDTLSTLEEINAIREKAKELLEQSEVQKAKEILAGLASEIDIQVTSIPLASYPQAIRAVSPLIDQGKLDEAKNALRAALSTMVVTENVIPIPILRAEMILRDAEPLAEKRHRSQDERAQLTELLDNAKYQIRLAKALGYGEKEEHEMFLSQIAQIEKKTEGDKAGKGFFDEVKKSLKQFRETVFG